MRRCHEEQLCDIILNLDQWFRSCRLQDFLSGALATLMFSGAEQLKHLKFGPVVVV